LPKGDDTKRQMRDSRPRPTNSLNVRRLFLKQKERPMATAGRPPLTEKKSTSGLSAAIHAGDHFREAFKKLGGGPYVQVKMEKDWTVRPLLQSYMGTETKLRNPFDTKEGRRGELGAALVDQKRTASKSQCHLTQRHN